MTYQSKNPIVTEAIEKAWENSKTQKEAAEKYLQMLRNDKELRDAATARYLQRIASEDVSSRSRANRISFRREAEKISKQVVLQRVKYLHRECH
jgi:predicted Ser/Thr protein kinase